MKDRAAHVLERVDTLRRVNVALRAVRSMLPRATRSGRRDASPSLGEAVRPQSSCQRVPAVRIGEPRFDWLLILGERCDARVSPLALCTSEHRNRAMSRARRDLEPVGRGADWPATVLTGGDFRGFLHSRRDLR